jgi:hypothetical protein
MQFQSASLGRFAAFCAAWLCYENIKLSFTIWNGITLPIGNATLLRNLTVEGGGAFNQASEHTNQAVHASSKKKIHRAKVPVFYNLFIADKADAARVKAFVNDQFSFLRPQHRPIYVNSIGYHIELPNTTLLKHYESESEAVTLQALWEYCKAHQDEIVVYLHSKG